MLKMSRILSVVSAVLILVSSQLLGYFITSLWTLLVIVGSVAIIVLIVLIVLFVKKRLVFIPKKDVTPKSKES